MYLIFNFQVVNYKFTSTISLFKITDIKKDRRSVINKAREIIEKEKK